MTPGGIAQHAAESPEKEAISSPDGSITFGALDENHRRIAAAMAADGLGSGDRIAVMALNRIETLEVTIAALRAGVIPVPMNPALTRPEIDYILRDSGARWFVTYGEQTSDARGLRVVDLDRDRHRLFQHPATDIAPHARGRPMHYTSGTTGAPKGVWVDPYSFDQAASMSESFRSFWDLRDEDVHLVCSPLAHSAPHRYAARTLEAGGTVVLLGRFEARSAVEAIAHHRVTTTFMVPAHLERLLRETDLRSADLGSVRSLFHAGAAVRPATKRSVIDAFPDGAIVEFYSATENHFTRASSSEWLERPGTVGRPRPGARLDVRDEAGGSLPPQTVGHVWLNDPEAERFRYWGDAGKTADAWDGDWFTVGDMGHVDDAGYLFLSGRRTDLIISGGVNVYPQEVENALSEHPQVVEACVYGIADPEWGQRVEALVVAEGDLEGDALLTWARGRLASYKVPKAVRFVPELPRTATGKVKRPLP